MLKSDTEKAAENQERRSAHVIHYNLSYIVQGAEHGTDGAIVLLHDIPAGAFAWNGVIPLLAGTSRAVYAIDMLGYGLSEHPWPADTSIWGHADCLSILFDDLDLRNVILVGHGIGGGVAQVLATRLSPNRVAALILVDTIAYEYSFAPNWPLPDMKKCQDPDAPKHISVEDMIKQLGSTLPQGVQAVQRFNDVINNYVDQWNSELGKEVLYQHIRQLLPNYSNSVASDLKQMGKPTLIIWGEKDEQIPLKLGQRLHREIAESRLVIVPGAGHLILFDASEQVASAITDFIGRL
jgi:pimeloyl-ACP methyl ester carboxylesterase